MRKSKNNLSILFISKVSTYFPNSIHFLWGMILRFLKDTTNVFRYFEFIVYFAKSLSKHFIVYAFLDCCLSSRIQHDKFVGSVLEKRLCLQFHLPCKLPKILHTNFPWIFIKPTNSDVSQCTLDGLIFKLC